MSSNHLCLYRASTSHLSADSQSTSRCEITFENGDVTHPGGDPADLLIISAFPNDYSELEGTVIGALADRGLSVGRQVRPGAELVEGSACWISQKLDPQGARAASAAQLFCGEGAWQGGPKRVLENLRALFSALLTRAPHAAKQAWSIHMPLIGAGDAGGDPATTLRWIVTAFQEFFANGLNVRSVRIIVKNEEIFAELRRTFRELRDRYTPFTADVRPRLKHKLFISYSHADRDLVEDAHRRVKRARPDIGRDDVFFDIAGHVKEGMILSRDLTLAVRQSRAMAAVISPTYLASPYCRLEFATAFNLSHLRQGRFSLKTVLLQDPGFLPNPSDYRDVMGAICPTSEKLADWIGRFLRDLERTPPDPED